jgi:DinB family protein
MTLDPGTTAAFPAIAAELRRTIETALPRLRGLSDADASTPRAPGKWSPKQVIGHLIDSASNNHQRFVRACLQESLEFPGYDQNGCVRLQAPNQADWNVLVSLWAAYNQYLAHVIARIPASKLETPCRIGSGEPVTLRFLAEDYVRHLVHHLEQIGIRF